MSVFARCWEWNCLLRLRQFSRDSCVSVAKPFLWFSFFPFASEGDDNFSVSVHLRDIFESSVADFLERLWICRGHETHQ